MSEAPHTVKSYEEELKNLNANIIKMGSACEDALGKAIQAITTILWLLSCNLVCNTSLYNFFFMGNFRAHNCKTINLK